MLDCWVSFGVVLEKMSRESVIPLEAAAVESGTSIYYRIGCGRCD